MLIALLSLAGIPGTAGFMAKFMVFGSAIQYGEWQTLALAIVAVVASVIAAFYYLNVARYIFFEKAGEEDGPVKVSPWLSVALAVTGAAILIVGIYPQPFIEFATESMYMLGVF